MAVNTDGLKRLWKTVFGDPDSFIDAFFRIAYSPDRCRYIEEQGQIVSALYWFDCEYEGGKLAYIYAVATHPDHRGKGLASRLLEETHDHLKALGYAGTVLKPAKGLFPFYERLGYTISGYVRYIAAKAAQTPVELMELSPHAYSSGRLGYLPKDRVAQRGVIIDFLASFAKFYGYYDSIICVSREEPVVIEYMGSAESAPGILAALGIKEAELPTFGTDIPHTMWHPLNCTKKPGYLGITLE